MPDSDVPGEAFDSTDAHENTLQLPPKDGINPVMALRIARHFTSDDPEDNKKAWKQGTAAIFAYLCDVLEIDRSGINMKAQSAKQKLYDLVNLLPVFLCCNV